MRELLVGVKHLRGGGVLSLERAMAEHQSVVKVDCWGLITDEYGYSKFMEVTNYFDMWSVHQDTETGALTTGRLTAAWSLSYIENLNSDIRRYYGHASMKAAKRLWMRAVLVRDQEMLRVLYPLFSSPAAALSQVAAEADTLCQMVSQLGGRHGMLLKVLDPVLSQVMGFSKRIKSNLTSEHHDSPNTPSKFRTTRFLFEQIRGTEAVSYTHLTLPTKRIV
eukprot:TRINITY_DN9471_c0_g1_i2.p1 TRINITY_DN9471_c0_g1~~TRINITY_DN9471_c0_g1_i2.p1  ORF type:complete len:221 (-),score=53.64 TRINITY_DN9471_c0_g1_i2:138-800(-)